MRRKNYVSRSVTHSAAALPLNHEALIADFKTNLHAILKVCSKDACWTMPFGYTHMLTSLYYSELENSG
jgi:hypothetical protein